MVKKVLVIGGTGAQGAHVVKSLVEDGAYSVRVLTRDTESRRAKELLTFSKDSNAVELVQGLCTNERDLTKAFVGIDLAFVNLDGFAIGEKAESFWGMRIYELAIQAGVKHYVWGGLDYGLRDGNYNPKYRCGHYDGKGRVTQWLLAQSKGSIIKNLHFAASLTRTRNNNLYCHQRALYAPLGDGAIPMIALEDLGYYTRWVFDHPSESDGLDLKIATQDVYWADLAKTFTKVTGKAAVYKPLEFDHDLPAAYEAPDGLTWRENFTGWWNLWRDRIIKRDYEHLYKIHPDHFTLESWLVKNNYTGEPKRVLKLVEDGKSVGKAEPK